MRISDWSSDVFSSALRAHVIGDTIVDSLTVTSVIGASGKTPTLSVRYEGKRDYVGGAGIVAKHLKAAGAEVTLSTVLGDDAIAGFVREDQIGRASGREVCQYG